MGVEGGGGGEVGGRKLGGEGEEGEEGEERLGGRAGVKPTLTRAPYKGYKIQPSSDSLYTEQRRVGASKEGVIARERVACGAVGQCVIG